jgi:hypothetical protein
MEDKKILRLRVFENKVLRRISGTSTEEVAGRWRDCTTHSTSDTFVPM